MAIRSGPNGTYNAKYTDSTALKGGEVLEWTAAGTVQLAEAVTDAIAGVALAAHPAGNVTPQNVGFALLGSGNVVECIAGASITVLDYVTVTTGGEVITTTAKATYEANVVEWIIGRALEAAGAQGDVISVQLIATSQSQ
jgi:hypothetical protein